MKTLSTEHRRQLERTVVEARDIAEAGARGALEALAVHHHEPYGHMSGEQRKLRNRLRAHARHLGDRVDARSGAHAIDHLIHECAYEHWHGMLFARFLAENQLLIEPEMGIAITLDECEELAKEAGPNGKQDKWALAARFAHRMLPQVFRPDHPVFEVQFAREYRLRLEGLVEALPAEVFTATDALGWVYQFWQTRKKDEVNRSEVKIGADELPAVTQLFTEPYMVQFLLHNSLGAWWVSRHSDKACPVDLRYLRYAEGVSGDRSPVSGNEGATGGHRTPDTGHPEPAAGRFEGWPDDLAEFRLLDPCCGSGHFLVAAFLMLVPMRMVLEGLDAAQAVDAVLRENIHGLELDQRCVAIAAFALALEAWRFPDAGGFRTLPKLNLAWCGQPVAGKKEQWLALAEGDSRLEAGMAALYDTFRDAPTLGSLIDPARSVSEDILTAGFDQLQPLLEKALRKHTGQEEWEETAIAALGLANAAQMLSGSYHLVITNFPYLGRGDQSEGLKKFCEGNFPEGKHELAASFLQRTLRLLFHAGTVSVVVPRIWLTYTAYFKALRSHLLSKERWSLLAVLGKRAFDTIGGEVVDVVLLTLSRITPSSGDELAIVNASLVKGADAKATSLRNEEVAIVDQFALLRIPGNVILADAEVSADQADLLAKSVTVLEGISRGDTERFDRCIWELEGLRYAHWLPLIESSIEVVPHGGVRTVFLWEGGKGDMALSSSSRVQGREAWGIPAVFVSRTHLNAYLTSGTAHAQNGVAIVPNVAEDLPAIWTYCQSDEYRNAVLKLNQKLIKPTGVLDKVEFDRDRWTKVARDDYPNGLPQPYSNDPTQLIFHGHPCGSVVWDRDEKQTTHGSLRSDGSVLHVAVARLLGYHWPAELDPGMELADEQREWVDRAAKLSSPTPGTRHPTPLIDDDGIVCIPSVRGERPAHERLLQLLHAAYGEKWNDGILSKLLAESGSASLDDWLRNQFFDEHCKLFQHRPFIWHIWDGRKRDGFHALVNYHKIAGSDFGQPKAGPKGEPQGRGEHKLTEGDGKGRRLLESLTYSYLGDWIARQQDGVKRGEGGADDRLAAALELQKRLVAILEGEPPFDIFVRWKAVEEQSIGWDPDINNGVRINIRPFMAQDLPGGKKGAGILRAKPNIHWKKDRGKEPIRDEKQFPWFWNNGKFTGERVNDVHLTNAEKRSARERAREKT